MSKRAGEETVYHGQTNCQHCSDTGGNQCIRPAYFELDGWALCGHHADINHRKPLPRDRGVKRRKLEGLAQHHQTVETVCVDNQAAGLVGNVACQKMAMMREVVMQPGYLHVYPNNKHQGRQDGLGCAALSPMRLGPVHHRQPGLPAARNIENMHQFSKVWPCEVDSDGAPSHAWRKKRLAGYLDPEPHRHKFSAREMTKQRAAVGGKNRNAPLYAVYQTLQGGEERRFSYRESRYFYCKAYEALATQTDDFRRLQELRAQGTNLLICGYDAYPVTQSLYDHYCDESRAFGHELVLYTLLSMADSALYPWNMYRANHPDLYEGVAHVV